MHFLSNGVPNCGAPGHQRHQLAERAGADQLLRHRHLDDQPAHAERRRAVRPLPRVAAGAGRSRSRASTPSPFRFPSRSRSRGVQPPRAAPGRDLRPHGRRQDGAEGQLGPLLLQHRRQPGGRDQPEHQRPVRGLELDRPQRRPHLPGRRRDDAHHPLRRRRERLDRSQPGERLHRRGVGLRRARRDGRTSACASATSGRRTTTAGSSSTSPVRSRPSTSP